MQNAMLTWTEYPDYHLQKKKNSGPKLIVKTFKIENCTNVKESKLSGIEIICTNINETEIDEFTESDIEIAKDINPTFK